MFEIIGFVICFLIGLVLCIQGFFGFFVLRGLDCKMREQYEIVISLFIIGVIITGLTIYYAPFSVIVKN